MTEDATPYVPQQHQRWPVPLITEILIKDEIGQFLRTHRDGDVVLRDLLNSVPPDRTEEQFNVECAERRARHDEYVERRISEENVRRAQEGLLPITRQDLK
jgi:hypothetical protein